MNREQWLLTLIIGGFTVLRLIVAPLFGLGVDEAHYILYARHIDWSYLDHPPLVGWIHFLFYRLLGTGEFLARLPAILLFAVNSLLVYNFTVHISNSPRTALWATVAINSSFLLNALGLMLLPDSILFVLIFLIINQVVKIEETNRLRYYALLGLLMGLAGLAKYTSILFVPALIIYFLIKRQLNLIFSAKMMLAGSIALVIISPVLYWNYQEGFVGFNYQLNRVFTYQNLEVHRSLTSLAAQFGAYSPFLFLTAWYGFFRGLGSRNDYLLLASLLGGVIPIFFLFSSFFEIALPHWIGVFYILFIPIGVHFLSLPAGRFRKYFLNVAIYFSLAVTIFLYLMLAGKFIGFPDYKSPFRDIYGYDLIAREADAILKSNPKKKKALAVGEWTMGSRIMYYSIPFLHKVFVIDERKDQFDLWQKNPPEGYDLLVIDSHFSERPFVERLQCDRTEMIKHLDLIIQGGKVDTISFEWCYNYKGKKVRK